MEGSLVLACPLLFFLKGPQVGADPEPLQDWVASLLQSPSYQDKRLLCPLVRMWPRDTQVASQGAAPCV